MNFAANNFFSRMEMKREREGRERARDREKLAKIEKLKNSLNFQMEYLDYVSI